MQLTSSGNQEGSPYPTKVQPLPTKLWSPEEIKIQITRFLFRFISFSSKIPASFKPYVG